MRPPSDCLRRKTLRTGAGFVLLFATCVLVSDRGYASEAPKPGTRYKILRTLYLMGVYDSLNNREVTRATARAYLHTARYANTSSVAFQSEVPAGTVMTILGQTSKV